MFTVLWTYTPVAQRTTIINRGKEQQTDLSPSASIQGFHFCRLRIDQQIVLNACTLETLNPQWFLPIVVIVVHSDLSTFLQQALIRLKYALFPVSYSKIGGIPRGAIKSR